MRGTNGGPQAWAHRFVFVLHRLTKGAYFPRSGQPLPRHVEYFAHLRRISDRPWVTANKHVLHGPRGDRIIVVPPHSHVAQSSRLPEGFDKPFHRCRGISGRCSKGLRDCRLLCSTHGSVPAQNARQHYARAVSVRYFRDSAKLMTDAMTGTPINAS
jgi:hypothetical protein